MPDDRYTVRKDNEGFWSVLDILAGLPVSLQDQVMIRMNLNEADDMVDLLNHLDRQRRRASGQ